MPVVIAGGLAHVSGQISQDAGGPIRGRLGEELSVEQGAAATSGPVVVFPSAGAVYLPEPDRRAFAATMQGLVAAGTCHWVSNEGPNVLPEMTGDAPPTSSLSTDFVLALDGRALAWTHGHGRALDWFGDVG